MATVKLSFSFFQASTLFSFSPFCMGEGTAWAITLRNGSIRENKREEMGKMKSRGGGGKEKGEGHSVYLHTGRQHRGLQKTNGNTN
jgi:hypothetical protein